MSNVIAKGGNAPIASVKLTIKVQYTGNLCDLSALLTAGGKVRSDADFIFFNQPQSVDGSVVYTKKPDQQPANSTYTHELTIDLTSVSSAIDSVPIALTLDSDSPGTFGDLQNVVLSVMDSSGNELVTIHPVGGAENAFVLAEVYRYKDGWKVRHIAQGYTSGLAGIATDFGVSIDDSPAPPATAPTPPPAPAINMNKPEPVKVTLTKRDKPVLMEKTPEITVTAAWENICDKRGRLVKELDYDLYAHIIYDDGTSEVVNFDTTNKDPKTKELLSRNGMVRHSGDVKTGGREYVKVKMTGIKFVGFSFYSARKNGTGSFKDANARVEIDNGSGSMITLGVSDMEVHPNLYTLYFGTIANKGTHAVEIIAQEIYSKPRSEYQVVLHADGTVERDAGPENRYKS